MNGDGFVIANNPAQSSTTRNQKGALLKYEGASEYTGLTERSLKHLVAKRLIPVVHIGRRVYFRQSDLDQLIENGTQG